MDVQCGPQLTLRPEIRLSEFGTVRLQQDSGLSGPVFMADFARGISRVVGTASRSAIEMLRTDGNGPQLFVTK
jgi:hypothetical protein